MLSRINIRRATRGVSSVQFRDTYHMYINGQYVHREGEQYFEVRNPATTKQLCRYESSLFILSLLLILFNLLSEWLPLTKMQLWTLSTLLTPLTSPVFGPGPTYVIAQKSLMKLQLSCGGKYRGWLKWKSCKRVVRLGKKSVPVLCSAAVTLNAEKWRLN
jgi:hypothetical protein